MFVCTTKDGRIKPSCKPKKCLVVQNTVQYSVQHHRIMYNILYGILYVILYRILPATYSQKILDFAGLL